MAPELNLLPTDNPARNPASPLKKSVAEIWTLRRWHPSAECANLNKNAEVERNPETQSRPHSHIRCFLRHAGAKKH
jgi:hypothetical protein